MLEALLTAPPNTLSTSYLPLNPSPTDHRSPWRDSPHDSTNIVINISSNDGSTSRGILIGMLSAFGSAAFVVLVFAIFYFFRYTNRGRIFLDRIGRPGEYDDDQALAREEADALEGMDDLQRVEYLRAKGMLEHYPYVYPFYQASLLTIASSSFYPSQSTRDSSNRHFVITIPGHTREGCVSMGV